MNRRGRRVIAMLATGRRVRPTGTAPVRGFPHAIALAAILAVCAGSVAGCGLGSTHASNGSAESSATTPGGDVEAREERAAKRRAARLKKLEVAEEANIRQKVEALRKAQAEAGVAPSPKSSNAKKHAGSKAKKSSGGSSKKPKSESKPSRSSGESAAEKAARRQFAREEAQEEASFKKLEREEAAGR